MLNFLPRHYELILWDLDGTLLNFYPAERYAITTTMAQFGLPVCTDAMVACYSRINEQYWRRMELGEITKKQVLEGRFARFFAELGCSVPELATFNLAYQKNLGARVFFHEGAYELVDYLKGRLPQYAVTNGTSVAQALKLRNSGLDKLLDGAFISDQIGYEKPSPGFFAYVERHIPPVPKEKILLVGDSLTSDIQGGRNMGVHCCWFNPFRKETDFLEKVKPDYVITDLNELQGIL